MSATAAEAGFRLACDADFSLASFPPDDDDAITRLDGGNEAAPVTSTIVIAIFEARGIDDAYSTRPWEESCSFQSCQFQCCAFQTRRLKLAVGATLESGIHFKKLPSLWNLVS